MAQATINCGHSQSTCRQTESWASAWSRKFSPSHTSRIRPTLSGQQLHVRLGRPRKHPQRQRRGRHAYALVAKGGPTETGGWPGQCKSGPLKPTRGRSVYLDSRVALRDACKSSSRMRQACQHTAALLRGNAGQPAGCWRLTWGSKMLR